jgi:hypothetical protein
MGRPLSTLTLYSSALSVSKWGGVADASIYHSKLRGCDLVRVKIGDLVSGGRVRSRAIIAKQKTGRPVQFEYLEPIAAAFWRALNTETAHQSPARGGSARSFGVQYGI